MKCSYCNQDKTVIEVEETGAYCKDCLEKMMRAQISICGDEDGRTEFELPMRVIVNEQGYTRHCFDVNCRSSRSAGIWDAVEKNGGYEIHDICRRNQNEAAFLTGFFYKILTAVSTKTLTRSHFKSAQNLKPKGNIGIERTDDGSAAFRIDGCLFTLEELGEMLGNYEGLNIRYQIHEISDRVLEEDELLQPIRTGLKHLAGELNKILCKFMKDEQICSENSFAFIESVQSIFGQLELMYKSDMQEEARAAAEYVFDIFDKLIIEDEYLKIYLKEKLQALMEPGYLFGQDDETRANKPNTPNKLKRGKNL